MVNEARPYSIIQAAKSLIIQTNRPHSCSFYAICYARSKHSFPTPHSGQERAALFALYPAGDHRAVHLVDHVKTKSQNSMPSCPASV
jgi:hypothetical protein